MKKDKCEKIAEELKKSLKKSGILCEKLINLIEAWDINNIEIQDKNLFHLDIVFQQLKNIQQSLELIVVNPSLVKGLQENKIISFDSYNNLKQLSNEKDFVYMDLTNPIDIFLKDD